MPDSYGPRTYLVGRIISALIIAGNDPDDMETVECTVTLSDRILDRMAAQTTKPEV